MSKSDIQSWLSSSGNLDEDEESGSGGSIRSSGWHRDKVMNEWTTSINAAQDILLKSRTSTRIRFLREELSGLAKHADPSLLQTLDVFKLLTLTYPRYPDNPSREAVEEVGMLLVRRDEEREQKFGVAEQIVGWISNEVGKFVKRGSPNSFAPSDLFVLLSWCCGIYAVCLEANPTFTQESSYKSIVGSIAVLLDMISESNRSKSSLKSGALVRVRRVLRSSGDKIPTLVTNLVELVTSKNSQNPLKFIQLIGVAVAVLVRLKNVKEAPSDRISEVLKSQILSLYISIILMSRSPVPQHILISLEDFIRHFVTSQIFETEILPTADKALLRSPEFSLDVLLAFFSSYSHSLSTESFKRVLMHCINTAKSSNPAIRTSSVGLYKALTICATSVEGPGREELLSISVTELLALPKAGKTAGPDHRLALYSMLALLPPLPTISQSILQASAALLAKETHEGATGILSGALRSHLACVLRDSPALGKEMQEVAGVIAKEMQNTKPSMRRWFFILAGGAVWESTRLGDDRGEPSDALGSFIDTILPALENILKTVSANPTSGTGVLEAYIAVALLLGPCTRFNRLEAVIVKNVTLQAIAVTGSTKPSFLLWDKVYGKSVEAKDEENERWLLRATEAALVSFREKTGKSETLRTQFGLVYLHLALNGSTPSIRKDAPASISSVSNKDPAMLRVSTAMVRDALSAFLSRYSHPASEEKPWSKHSQLAWLLLSSVSSSDSPTFDDASEGSEEVNVIKAEAVVQAVIIAHHELVSAPSRKNQTQTWIDMCQRAGIDPRELVSRNLDRLMVSLQESSLGTPSSGFPAAAYRALKVVAFVNPLDVLPRVVSQLQEDISKDVITALTEEELGIWSTEEGTLYVDVLSSTKDASEPSRKGKDSEINRWEDELRKSLASKKAQSQKGAPVLTKQQQALVQAQLAKEANIRKKVEEIKQKILRGLGFVRSLVETFGSAGEEFKPHISQVVTLLLEGALIKGGEFW
ncbi:hypothetical protein D9757_005117 [Collybiopsis confluens]|uniref:Tubulin-specific chaperone D n=1 Tax=Collybiopsis confluens TaxID=2823264 RepID=A0A8H5HSX4_9AGAR|nr:hypothetical protein D9757_005117 [Collybiopsis confluens]